MSSGRSNPDPSRPSASVWQPADWPVMDAELARFEAQLMQLAEYRQIANFKLNRLFRHMAMAKLAGRPPPAALLDERRRLSRALGAIQYVEDVTIERRKTRLAELGIVHH